MESIDGKENYVDNWNIVDRLSENQSNDLLNQRIYDDPCDLRLLDDSKLRFRLTRSRSWFCCPTTTTTNSETSDSKNSFFENKYTDYLLITEPPQTQLQIV